MTERVIHRLFEELKSMVMYASGAGSAVPPEIIALVYVIENKLAAETEGDKVQLNTQELHQIAQFHSQMADMLAPAKPKSIYMIQQKAHGIFRFLGPVSLVRQLSVLSLFFLLSTVLLALSEEVNRVSLNKGVFESSGITLLFNLLFLLSCAGLGAAFSCLNQLFYYINNTTYDPKFNVTYWIKILMGLMSGLILCELVSFEPISNGAEQSLVDLDKPLIALLGGFSSDLLYHIFARILQEIQRLFGKPEPKQTSLSQMTLMNSRKSPASQNTSLTPSAGAEVHVKQLPDSTPISETPKQNEKLKGQLTYDAEGTEGGRYHSRKLYVPSAASGLTIGRGYDCKEKNKDKITHDLCQAGIEPHVANIIASASGLHGDGAKAFITDNKLQDFEISIEQQKTLFVNTYTEMENDVKRICRKPDCVAAYGAVNWQQLNPLVKDVLIDLRYRGDYTPQSRKLIQRYIADNDTDSFQRVLAIRQNWMNVPEDRFNRRNQHLN